MARQQQQQKKQKKRKGRVSNNKHNSSATSSAGELLLQVDPLHIRFQHARIRPFFSGCGRRVEDTLQAILQGRLQVSELPPIQVIPLDSSGASHHHHQEYVSLNNRRLWVLKRCREQGIISTTIGVRVRTPKSEAERNRYTMTNCAAQAKFILERKRDDDNGGHPTTTQEAKGEPIQRQEKEEDSASFPAPTTTQDDPALGSDDDESDSGDDDDDDEVAPTNRFSALHLV